MTDAVESFRAFNRVHTRFAGMPVRRRSLCERRRNDTCVWSDSGTKKLPFAGYSVAALPPDRGSHQSDRRSKGSLQIVWDDLRMRRADIWRVTNEEPQATKIEAGDF